MSLARPELAWLILAAPLALALLVALWRRRRVMAARALGDPSLVERIGLRGAARWPTARLVLLLIAGAALGAAAAGPQWGIERLEGRSSARNIVMALDVSRSMNARDLEPSRLERERLLARRLLRSLSGDRFGLVAFAGRAYVLSPLTVDHGALQLFVDALDPEIVSYGGSALSAAVRQATDLVRGERPNSARRAVVLVSDGEALEQREAVLEAAERAADLGVVVHTVGVGTEGGSLIPRDRDASGVGGFVIDESGQRVVSRLDDRLLREVAQATGGEYFRLADAGSTERLIDTLEGLDREAAGEAGRVRPVDRSVWFLALALLALALDALLERRRARPAPVTAMEAST